MGPIGIFFARFCRYLLGRGVPVTKVIFPLHEFGFPAEVRVPFRGDMEAWRPFLEDLIRERSIRHIFMYGDFIIPHRIAIEVAKRAGIDAFVFELGYLRPNYVSLERDRVNSRSHLNRPVEFYRSLPCVDRLPSSVLNSGWRWRKIWKAVTFVQHSFVNYKVIESEHKLQPRVGYLWCQLRGEWRFWIYQLQERSLKQRLLKGLPFFLVILQVSSDTQISMGSDYRGMHDFIEDVVSSFSRYAHASDHLAFKHHPRDRGYNHYGALIDLLAERFGVAGRIHYFHDGALSIFLRASRGVVTVNSTVGIQALYHAVPTKVMGRTFYNLPGLSDQQPLDAFWACPQPSDRSLFYKFYTYMLSTTQVNGNFDGDFPFQATFPVGHRIPPVGLPLAPRASAERDRQPWWRFLVRALPRLVWAVGGFTLYGFQLLLLKMGRRQQSASVLSSAASLALRSLGIVVIVDDSKAVEPEGVPLIHIYNHESPFDVLVIQGALRMPSLTTATLHLGRVLLGFEQSAVNAGHGLMDHRNADSRLAGLVAASRTLEQHGELILAPNGSLMTPIQCRVSTSALLLSRRHHALIVPWLFSYRGFNDAPQLRYRPLRLLLSRLTSPIAVIHCRRGRSSDLSLPVDPGDKQGFIHAVKAFYQSRCAVVKS